LEKVEDNKKAAEAAFLLGRVDLCCLFLQQLKRYLYKAELMIHSYSIRIGVNAVEMAYKRCPMDSFKCALLFVTSSLHRITMLHSLCLEQNPFNSNKN